MGKKRAFNRPRGRHSYRNKCVRKMKDVIASVPSYVLPLGYVHKFVSETKKGDDSLIMKTTPAHVNRFYRISNSNGLRVTFVKSHPKMLNPNECRIINLDKMSDYVSDITIHSALCDEARSLALKGQKTFVFIGEMSRHGLASVLRAQCMGCHRYFDFNTSNQVHTPNSCSRFEVNIRAVWGQMATGGGCARLNEVSATLGMPGMTNDTFSSLEHQIGQWWHDALDKEMRLAGAKEKELAIERGEYHQGVPSITVVCDGGGASGAISILIMH